LKVLAQHGITSLVALREMKPSRIEVVSLDSCTVVSSIVSQFFSPKLLNRRPPFGTAVLGAVKELPQFTLSISEVSLSSSKGKGPVTAELEIECALLISSEPQASGKKPKPSSLGMTAILTLTSDNDFIDFRRIP